VLIVKVLLEDVRKRAVEAEKQRAERWAWKKRPALQRADQARSAPDERVARGCGRQLDVQATVTEDITGAIADSSTTRSKNYAAW